MGNEWPWEGWNLVHIPRFKGHYKHPEIEGTLKIGQKGRHLRAKLSGYHGFGIIADGNVVWHWPVEAFENEGWQQHTEQSCDDFPWAGWERDRSWSRHATRTRTCL